MQAKMAMHSLANNLLIIIQSDDGTLYLVNWLICTILHSSLTSLSPNHHHSTWIFFSPHSYSQSALCWWVLDCFFYSIGYLTQCNYNINSKKREWITHNYEMFSLTFAMSINWNYWKNKQQSDKFSHAHIRVYRVNMSLFLHLILTLYAH